MKRSNKLLAGFAAALFLIPLVGMVYVSQVNYKKGTYQDRQIANENRYSHFNTPVSGWTSKAMGPFTSVKIDESGAMSFSVVLVNDAQSGVRVPKDIEGSITLQVDDQGCLHIALKEGRQNDYRQIVIYSPAFHTFDIEKASDVELATRQGVDSLTVNVHHTAAFRLAPGTTMAQLRVEAVDTKEISLHNVSIQRCDLQTGGANFYATQSSFERLSLKASGNAELQIGTDGGNAQAYTIRHLDINTSDNVAVKIGDVKIEQCSGSFSDGTRISGMQAVNLNQLYKR